tara:strand:- start:161 stop:349 length:189 start_codon:yes stop_codon:yes gene_type:complete
MVMGIFQVGGLKDELMRNARGLASFDIGFGILLGVEEIAARCAMRHVSYHCPLGLMVELWNH